MCLCASGYNCILSLYGSEKRLINVCIINILTYPQDQEIVEEDVEFVITEELRKSAPMISALYEVLTTLQVPTDGTQSTSLNKVSDDVTQQG